LIRAQKPRSKQYLVKAEGRPHKDAVDAQVVAQQDEEAAGHQPQPQPQLRLAAVVQVVVEED